MVPVAVGADDGLRCCLGRAALEPEGDDLPGGGVVRGVALLAGRVDLVGRVQDLGRGGVVLVVPVRVGLPVTVHAGDVRGRVLADQRFLLVIRVADKTGGVLRRRPGRGWRGRRLCLGGFVQQQRLVLVHHQRRRAARFFHLAPGGPDHPTGQRITCTLPRQEGRPSYSDQTQQHLDKAAVHARCSFSPSLRPPSSLAMANRITRIPSPLATGSQETNWPRPGPWPGRVRLAPSGPTRAVPSPPAQRCPPAGR